MQDNQRQHSGIDMARRIVSAARIAKAAAAGGVHGTAVAAAKEAAPFLAKLAIWALVALIALPMLIFAYLPNIFFGFSSSGTAPVARMTGQAMTLGGFYMDLEDFENTQIDAIVTSLIQQYEEAGIEIDGVEINSDFDEDDLRRFIAISSVAYQQDLEVMTTEAVLSLATSRLRYEPTLNIFEFGGLLKRTLVIKIDHLDPEAFMDQLSFEEDARTWAGALYEVLTESNALEEYAEYYAPYRPNYSGDTGYTGDYEHGGSYGDTIDTSGFVSPSTKNNVDLAAYAMQAWENNWGYCWGTYGNVLTEALFNYKLQQYPEGVGKYEDFIRANWLGRRTADCIGLIKGYDDTANTMTIRMTDTGLSEINEAATVYTNSVKRGYSDCTMRISYAATLTADAKMGDTDNPNEVVLTWRRTNNTYFDTLKDCCHVYTYGIDVLKQFSDNGGNVRNVKFRLHNDTDDCYIIAEQKDGVYYAKGLTAKKSDATTFIPNAQGHIVVKGLEDDAYSLTEIATDKGYVLLKDAVKIVIKTAENGTCEQCGAKLPTASATVNSKDITMTEGNAIVPLTVVNNPGFDLPKTGGYGTWMFTIGGVALLGAAAFIVIRSRKHKNEQ